MSTQLGTRDSGLGTLPLPSGLLADSFGRIARRLRISVTDRCNFRCAYCMPEEVAWLPKAQILSYEEMLRIVRVGIGLGVERVRVTGGEPLVRKGVETFVAALVRLPLRDVSLTTNAFYLDDMARPLWEAGLRRMNVSLDSLRRDRFRELVRFDGFEGTVRGIEAALAAGFRPLKLNMVVIRGHNEDEIVPMAEWCREREIELRYIEFMPLDGDRRWSRERVVPAAEIRERVAAAHPIEPVRDQDSSDPSRDWRYADGRGVVGFIASVTEAFCGSCDRIRLTADGKFRTCLFATKETDLREPLRAGATDEELGRLLLSAVAAKEAGHLINLPKFVQPARAMNAIGG